MTKLCLAKYGPTHDIIVTFANTGCEHPSTLKFVKNCDEVFLFKTVWIEAEVTHGERVGIRPRIVTHDTASRNGEPFEEYIKKYGIPNAGSPQCTSRLKTEAMEYYIRKVRGWDVGTYKTAIGIRADEMDRVSSKKDEYGFIYPLVDMGWTKAMVKAECRRWPFDLQIPGDHFGNCTWCWKKSLRKLLTVATEAPSEFDFPARMEATYGTHKAENAKGRRVFFRGDRSTLDILELAKQPFTPYTESTKFRQQTLWDDILDVGGGCGESCEIGADQ